MSCVRSLHGVCFAFKLDFLFSAHSPLTLTGRMKWHLTRRCCTMSMKAVVMSFMKVDGMEALIRWKSTWGFNHLCQFDTIYHKVIGRNQNTSLVFRGPGTARARNSFFLIHVCPTIIHRQVPGLRSLFLFVLPGVPKMSSSSSSVDTTSRTDILVPIEFPDFDGQDHQSRGRV